MRENPPNQNQNQKKKSPMESLRVDVEQSPE